MHTSKICKTETHLLTVLDSDQICADCGHEQREAEGHVCKSCGSRRLAYRHVIEAILGKDYRDAFRGRRGPCH